MKQYIKYFLSILLILTAFPSCESLLDVSPEEVLLEKDYLGVDKQDARSALFGVLGEMQELAGQYVVLGELSADLVDVNSASNDNLRQINRHEISADNSYGDSEKLFTMINNCNFALAGINTEVYDKTLLNNYASIMRIRTWAQMQILIHYGKLPYITKPIKTTADLNDKYPVLTADQAIPELIKNLEGVSGVANVTNYENSLGFNIFSMIPDQDILLGDLYLWKGDYVASATSYKKFLDTYVLAAGAMYNLTSTYGTTTTLVTGGYTFNNTKWGTIFQTTIQTNEVINYIGYNDQYRQPNNFYSVVTKQMKPSALVISNWGSQYRGNLGLPIGLGDFRSLSSYIGEGDLAQITKYQYEYFVWNRAAKIYLRYAEAINYAGYPTQALCIINGIFNNPKTLPNDAPVFTNVAPYLNFDKGKYYSYNTTTLVPTGGNLGIRGRVSMAPVSIDAKLTGNEAIKAVGQLILNESALELAFEGNRWEDLIRFARRANDPTIVAESVAQKFVASGDLSTAATIRTKLMNPENWYIKLVIPANFTSN